MTRRDAGIRSAPTPMAARLCVTKRSVRRMAPTSHGGAHFQGEGNTSEGSRPSQSGSLSACPDSSHFANFQRHTGGMRIA